MAKELVKQGETGLAAIFGDADLGQRPDFIPAGDKTGTEDLTRDDIRLPRVVIAQGLSPEVLPGNDRIEGLGITQMFNDFTKANYGNGPIYFVPIRVDKRCIEFRPRAEGGGIVDMNVPWNDKRATDWREKNGQRLPPAATRFYEWVALMLLNPHGDTEPIVISIKMTNKWNRRAASDLNSNILFHASQEERSVPIYGVVYSMESKSEKNDKGTFGVPAFKQKGYVPANEVGQRLFARAQEYAQALRGKEIVVEREPGDETDFPEVPAGAVEGTVAGEM